MHGTTSLIKSGTKSRARRLIRAEKENQMIKTKVFRFRITEKEFKEMKELAEKEGRTMSNLLRYLVAKEREEREK